MIKKKCNNGFYYYIEFSSCKSLVDIFLFYIIQRNTFGCGGATNGLTPICLIRSHSKVNRGNREHVSGVLS